MISHKTQQLHFLVLECIVVIITRIVIVKSRDDLACELESFPSPLPRAVCSHLQKSSQRPPHTTYQRTKAAFQARGRKREEGKRGCVCERTPDQKFLRRSTSVSPPTSWSSPFSRIANLQSSVILGENAQKHLCICTE